MELSQISWKQNECKHDENMNFINAEICLNFDTLRFLLTVIRCLRYHWLEVSREVDISRARIARDLFSDDRSRTSAIHHL